MKFNIISIFIFCLLLALPVNAQLYSSSTPTNFDAYVKMLKSKIQRRSQAYSFDRNYRALIGFKLDKLGNITDTRVLEKSESNDFDYNMSEAIMDSSPYSPLPYDFQGNEATFYVEFIAKDVIVSCKQATTDQRIIQRNNKLNQQLQQAQLKRQRLQQQEQLQQQQTINQTRSGVNSILRQFNVPVNW